MQTVNILKKHHIASSSRIAVLKALVDYPDDDNTQFNINIDIDMPDDWLVGLIVGPSGSGKTTLTKELFGDIAPIVWDETKAIFDNFALTPSETVNLLSAVGLSSIPTWLRPRHVLSGGEGFRADVARILETTDGTAVIDEFTSVVDRTVATAISVCVSKYARRKKQQVVCVSCHYDVMEWLQPDWVIDMTEYRYYRRSLCPRPTLSLDIGPVSPHKAWSRFEPHHYMNAKQGFGIRAWCAFLNGVSVAYTSYAILPHPKTKNIMMGSRLVVLPDYQGLGIGSALDNFVADHLHHDGYRVRNRTAHPGAQRIYASSKHWRCVHIGRMSPGGSRQSTIGRGKIQRVLCERITRCYEYFPQ